MIDCKSMQNMRSVNVHEIRSNENGTERAQQGAGQLKYPCPLLEFETTSKPQHSTAECK